MSTSKTRILDDAEELRTRPTPRTMALSCIYDEVEELVTMHTHATADPVVASVEERFREIAATLADRLDAAGPDCPVCGEPLGRSREGLVVCDHGHDIGEDARAEHKHVNSRLWGFRGHGGPPDEYDQRR